jgi:hypothetical protein
MRKVFFRFLQGLDADSPDQVVPFGSCDDSACATDVKRRFNASEMPKIVSKGDRVRYSFTNGFSAKFKDPSLFSPFSYQFPPGTSVFAAHCFLAQYHYHCSPSAFTLSGTQRGAPLSLTTSITDAPSPIFVAFSAGVSLATIRYQSSRWNGNASVLLLCASGLRCEDAVARIADILEIPHNFVRLVGADGAPLNSIAQFPQRDVTARIGFSEVTFRFLGRLLETFQLSGPTPVGIAQVTIAQRLKVDAKCLRFECDGKEISRSEDLAFVCRPEITVKRLIECSFSLGGAPFVDYFAEETPISNVVAQLKQEFHLESLSLRSEEDRQIINPSHSIHSCNVTRFELSLQVVRVVIADGSVVDVPYEIRDTFSDLARTIMARRRSTTDRAGGFTFFSNEKRLNLSDQVSGRDLVYAARKDRSMRVNIVDDAVPSWFNLPETGLFSDLVSIVSKGKRFPVSLTNADGIPYPAEQPVCSVLFENGSIEIFVRRQEAGAARPSTVPWKFIHRKDNVTFFLPLTTGMRDRDILDLVRSRFVVTTFQLFLADVCSVEVLLRADTNHFANATPDNHFVLSASRLRFRFLFCQPGQDPKTEYFPFDATVRDVKASLGACYRFSQNGKPIFDNDDARLSSIYFESERINQEPLRGADPRRPPNGEDFPTGLPRGKPPAPPVPVPVVRPLHGRSSSVQPASLAPPALPEGAAPSPSCPPGPAAQKNPAASQAKRSTKFKVVCKFENQEKTLTLSGSCTIADVKNTLASEFACPSITIYDNGRLLLPETLVRDTGLDLVCVREAPAPVYRFKCEERVEFIPVPDE